MVVGKADLHQVPGRVNKEGKIMDRLGREERIGKHTKHVEIVETFT